ncbi:FtsK/SpoIIIE domain-containing protein [Microlunatus flavus]|uniref:FtsK/SpoIIIE family protein n=1 Tax=Microlunatus flavus TaxID=1036181 RepID=A0A1H9D4J5_9ACTN|nr:FtsK/SpoIIIE domain-containing protein [Microlunatus flavus]SEQ08385.1 FtsK/SpoIIIE family protein [Microlunatus flavus]
MTSAVDAADVENRIRALVAALDDRTRQLATARERLRRSEAEWRRQAEHDVAHATEEARKALLRDRKAIESNAEEVVTSASRMVERMLEREAPGYLSAAWDDELWSTLPVERAGEWIRVGAVDLEQQSLPLTVPLSAGVWRVASSARDEFRAFVHNTIARVVAAFDPLRVRVLTFDPDLDLDLAALAGLRAVSQTSVPPALTSVEDLEGALDDLRTSVAAVDDRLTAAGQHTYWSALRSGHPLAAATPLRLLVIGAPPNGLTDRGRARLDQLRGLASDRGLLIIEMVQETTSAASPLHATITLRGDASTASTAPGLTWTPDTWAGESFLRRLSTDLTARPRQDAAPSVDFRRIVESIDDAWMAEADEGLEACIGSTDGGDLVVRLRAENPPMPNALVGGAVGEGKSNLLLVLVHSLAARYSPAELEMVLVDLRDGVEFARLGPTRESPAWLPHVRALGLEFDPDYSLGVLSWVRAQMSERARLLKAHGATTLRQYRARSGRTLPRMLVVIDEFQRMFEGDDDQAAAAAADLDNIARTGRGFGIHVVLASQALSGIRGLATKSDSLFSQFHNRIVLRNTAAESQAFLAPHNLAAADLEHRGQAVVNDSLGSLDKNKLGTVAFAQPDYLEQLQVQLFRQGHGGPPSIFRATAFATWPVNGYGADASRGVVAAVGLPVAVEARAATLTFTRSPNQALAVVGSQREVAISVLVRAVVTAAESIGPDARVLVLDGDSQGPAPAAWLSALVEHLRRRGHAVRHEARGTVAESVLRLRRDKGSVDLVVPVALDSVDLDTATEPDYELPSEALRDLLRSGPLSGTWTIGWWQSKPVLEEQLGFRASGVRAWAFAGVSRDDLTDIAGHATREPVVSPRFVWFDRLAGTIAQRLVPFDPEDVIGTADRA